MTQYIPKDALIAEIKRRKQTWQHQDQQYVAGGRDVCDYLLGFLDTLEVKEVDLEKEIDFVMPSKYCWSGDGEAVYSKEQMRNFAKHFFELGMQVSNKALKGE